MASSNGVESDIQQESETPHEAARDRTLYWTLSLYIDADAVHGPKGSSAVLAGSAHDSGVVRHIQLSDKPSRALRDAIEPLFNDIADREWLGQVHDFLIAAGDPGQAGDTADEQARAPREIVMTVPDHVDWITEGTQFISRPPGLGGDRSLKLRRFWFAHNNGALSYNLSFTVPYEHNPADYYYLAMLQKLAAPKEFALDPTLFARFVDEKEFLPNPIDDETMGIGPLDEIRLTSEGHPPKRFWPFVAELFHGDAQRLFAELAKGYGIAAPIDPERLLLRHMVPAVPVVEVPGLHLPKSRFMFQFQDQRFFNRLIPPTDPQGKRYPRKVMVQEDCYAPYQQRMADLVSRHRGNSVLLDWDREIDERFRASLADGTVDLAVADRDMPFWNWALTRPDYIRLVAEKKLLVDGKPSQDGEEIVAAARSGRAFRTDQQKTLLIPSLEPNRLDCLDYLFLSGFNQNIIDFMNQDTSEILDSIDPIYPKTDEQMDERFFVRFANHRAMITYVPRSRSLEVGNDYIGTCPYAFLIHALAMHNEFLARAHENRSFRMVEEIERAVEESDDNVDFLDVGLKINAVKLSKFHDFERFRHANVFRYDTERDVFAELEQLRGTDRKQQALELAVSSLEDHARDLDLRQQRAEALTREREANDRIKETDDRERRERGLNAVLGALGLFGFVDIFLKLGEYFDKHPLFAIWPKAPLADGRIWGSVLGNFGWILGVVGVIALLTLIWPLLRMAVRNFGAIRNYFRSLVPKNRDADEGAD